MAGAPASLFSAQARHCAWAWMAVSLPVVAVVAHFATTPRSYIVIFAVVASGFYTTPALVHTWLAARRATNRDKWSWWLWLAAVVVMYSIGCAILLGAATGLRAGVGAGAVAVVIVTALLMTATVMMVRSRSGGRAVSVDLVESSMSMLVLVAPLGLIWGERVLHASEAWYAIPAALAVPCTVFGVYWAVLLYLRLDHSSGAIGTIGVALASFGLVNAVGQTAQGVTGFALPPEPLLVLQGLCMSLVAFVPLYVPDRITPGLARLPPQRQVRGAWLPSALLLAGLPVLVVTTLAVRHRHPWAPIYSLCVAGVLLLLAALRQLLAVRETRRLYARLEQAAETRRELLAQVMQRSDDDRHRVAAQLHEQAVAAYATFVSFMQAGSLVQTSGLSPMAGASALVRDELGKQAESLRRLMLAVQPPMAQPRPGTLATPIRAYVDGLYGDQVAPELDVAVDDDIVLDWPTETVVLRIVQEAVHNAWRHSGATGLEVGVAAEDRTIVVRVADDGVGFAPGDAPFESGIGVMRSLAGLGNGTVDVDSAPGGGTRVTARLGPAGDAPGAPAPGVPPRLRVVADR
ncbi:MAG TPA: ATP-binding protein [Acidimicrobiales bacterium]|nr:ATP-binding protein [Acidimicrobiales bacterium]